MLSTDVVFQVLADVLEVGTFISMPILFVALLSGFSVGLLQALTSIQEMTLTFVPKLGAILVAFLLTYREMSNSLVEVFQSRLVPLISGGNGGY